MTPRMPRLTIAIVIAVATSSPAAAKTCWTEGPSQFADALHFCVSSVLQPQGGRSYSPENLSRRPKHAWCEGVRGHGIGETITIRIDRGPAFRRLQIKNGYERTARSFRENSRIKRLRITSDTGINATLKLVDQPGEQPVYLSRIAPHRWVRLEILDVYPGSRFQDTCVSMVSPDFVYEEELLQRQRQQPQQPVAPPATSQIEPTISEPAPSTLDLGQPATPPAQQPGFERLPKLLDDEERTSPLRQGGD